jgi:hypothetical protein
MSLPHFVLGLPCSDFGRRLVPIPDSFSPASAKWQGVIFHNIIGLSPMQQYHGDSFAGTLTI